MIGRWCISQNDSVDVPSDDALSDDDKAAAFEVLMWETVDKLFEELGGDKNKLSEHERQIIALWRLEADTYNGSIEQFICNWGLDEVQLAKTVLSRIGAVQALALLTQAQTMFDELVSFGTSGSLWDVMPLLSQAQNDKLGDINQIYWENADNICLLGYRYFCEK